MLQDDLRRLVHVDPVTMHQDGEIDLDLDIDPLAFAPVAGDQIVILVDGPALVLVDGATGATLDSLELAFSSFNPPPIAASPDGSRVFAVDTNDYPDFVTISVREGALELESSVTLPEEFVDDLLVLPDGSGVFADGYLHPLTDAVAPYNLYDTPRWVSGDSRLAISFGDVYRVQDGAWLGELRIDGPPVASADGSSLYMWRGGGLVALDLTRF